MSVNNVFLNVNHGNLEACSTVSFLPNDFKLSPDGKMAIKYCTIRNDEGVEKKYTFKIHLIPKHRDSNFESLKSFTDAKVKALTKQSIDLGLGVTLSGVNFSRGEKSKLYLKRRDGKEEIIDEKAIKIKQLELDQETNEEKKILLIKTIRAFFTIEYAVKDASSKKIIQKGTVNKNYSSEAIEKNIMMQEQLKEKQRSLLLSHLKESKDQYENYYKNNILVPIYYSHIYESQENVSLEELHQFYSDFNNFKK